MSEKRFKLIKPLGTRLGLKDIFIKDTQEDHYYNTKEVVVDLLNGLSEENEQLKKQLNKYDKLKISIFNKDKGDWKWNDNNDIILNIRNGKSFYLRNSGAVENLVGLLNEQQATIRKLQDLCGESDSENAKLRIENKKLKAKLKEKEEDEQLYANEIVKLNKEAKEVLDFKSLGGDY